MALLARHAAYEAAVVEATATGARHEALIEAMALNPMVSSVDQAAVLVDAILAGGLTSLAAIGSSRGSGCKVASAGRPGAGVAVSSALARP